MSLNERLACPLCGGTGTDAAVNRYGSHWKEVYLRGQQLSTGVAFIMGEMVWGASQLPVVQVNALTQSKLLPGFVATILR